MDAVVALAGDPAVGPAAANFEFSCEVKGELS